MATEEVPAAQYLRMSTDHQQYSLDNQADSIARYASDHGFAIVKTYCDAAKSGLRLKNRDGLRQLLKEVVEGYQEFSAVLVFDVSRWGRFQDADEAAHYEYLCKSSGVPVHYCAETFPNDNSMATLVMKALKRSMAGEYSRELSGKVRAGLARLTKMGYKAGGPPTFGLRRLLLDSSGNAKQVLSDGQRKSLATERVTLVPGPREEVATVRRIFHEFVNEHRSLRSIAKRLNQDGIHYLNNVEWDANDIRRILKHHNYMGNQVWGRTKGFLSSKPESVPPEQWIICENAFEPIIGTELFEKAQATFANLTCNLSDEEMIERLRLLLRSEGRLTSGIIERSLTCPSLTTYHTRFGGKLQAYKRIGYPQPNFISADAARQRTWLIRDELMEAFVKDSCRQLDQVRPSGRFRGLLRCRKTGLLISVLLARYRPTANGAMRWMVVPHVRENHRVTVLVLLDETNSAVKHLRLFPRLGSHRFALRQYSEFLRTGIAVERPSQLLDVVRRLRAQACQSGRGTSGPSG